MRFLIGLCSVVLIASSACSGGSSSKGSRDHGGRSDGGSNGSSHEGGLIGPDGAVLGPDGTVIDRDADGSISALPDGATPQPGTKQTVAQVLCSAFAYLKCESYPACGCTFEGDVPGCKERAQRECEAVLPTTKLGEALVDGRATADLSLLTQCTQQARKAFDHCGGNSEQLARLCQDAFRWDAALGETCSTGSCAGGAGSCRGGTCREVPGAGDVCTADCARGLACVAEPSALAGECGARSAGGGCMRDHDCVLGELCFAGTCQASESTPCDVTGQCLGGRSCAAGACKPRERLTCFIGPLERTGCAYGEVCRGNGRALACAPRRGAGEPCTFGGQCTAGLGCFDGVCKAPGDRACNVTQCPKESDCLNISPTETRCVVAANVGESCGSERWCMDGLTCSNDKCTGTLPTGGAAAGQSCNAQECAYDFTCVAAGECEPGQCTALPNIAGL